MPKLRRCTSKQRNHSSTRITSQPDRDHEPFFHSIDPKRKSGGPRFLACGPRARYSHTEEAGRNRDEDLCRSLATAGEFDSKSTPISTTSGYATVPSAGGALIHRVEQDRFRVLSDWNELALYQFHTRQAKDYFCKTCGILTFRRPRTAPHLWAVNGRCLEGVDLDSLKVERVFGSQLP